MKRLLIVDNDPDLLELVCHMVQAFNMDPKGILSGEDIIPALEAEKFDLVLMDVYLGDMDGRGLARQLKTNKQYQHIPVLLYSAGNISKESIDNSLADGFLKKPFNIHDLVQQVNSLMA